MKLYIKNMVSPRCKTLVRNELTKVGLRCESVELGEAEISENMSSQQFAQLETALLNSGLVMIDDVKTILVEKIKTAIIKLVHYSEERLEINLSVYLSRQLTHNYSYMATLFSEAQGYTIEKFFIEHKIERVKELLIYNELSLTEIADKMHYSSVAHLSSQFRKVTGNTASQYKRLRVKTRSMLEEL